MASQYKSDPVIPQFGKELSIAEWQKVKDAVYSSPTVQEAFLQYLARTVAEEVDKLVKQDKAELELLGVVEKSS